MVVLKAFTGHIVMSERYSYKNLSNVYPDIYKKVLEVGGNEGTQEDPTMVEVLLDDNMRAIRSDKKPAGVNRFDIAGVRLIFPIREDKQVEFYVSKQSRCTEVVGLTESISSILKKAGLKHTTTYDRSPTITSRSSFQPLPPPSP
jgi:hypothetical protein